MYKKLLLSLVGLICIVTIYSQSSNTQNFGNNFIYHEACDGATIFGIYVSKQNPMVHSIKQTSCYSFNGGKCAKFELRDTDTMNNSGTRSEITFPTLTNLNRWYSFAVLFPCVDWDYDSDDEVINQWHQGGGLTPALCIRTMKDSMYLRIVEDPGGDDTWINIGVIIKDTWLPFVLHVIHSSTTSGLVEIWRGGSKILSRSGKNMYPVTGSVTNPNWKLGIYKSGWNDANTTFVNRRVIFVDDIKMGSENSSYREMVPMSYY